MRSPNNCSTHAKEVAGISDMTKLAEMVGDLHYETLTDFLQQLSKKINTDAQNDNEGGREQLASALQYLGMSLFESALRSEQVWKICKPYMK
jgi:signal transduction histidine kinase